MRKKVQTEVPKGNTTNFRHLKDRAVPALPEIDEETVKVFDYLSDISDSSDEVSDIDSSDEEEVDTWLDIYKKYVVWCTEHHYPILEPKDKPKKGPKYDTSHRWWFLTINNPCKRDFDALANDDALYCAANIEQGEDGVNHIHACMYYKSARVMPLKKFPRAHIKKADYPEKCIEYCTKERTRIIGPWEWGKKPQQGKRNDLTIIRDRIKSGTSVRELTWENPALFHQYGRTLRELEDIAMSEKFRYGKMTTCTLFLGPTGTGKSHNAFEGYLDNPSKYYDHPDDKGWWDGYKQEDIVIINEYREAHVSFQMLLKLIDKWPTKVPRRNRPPLPFTSSHIIITAPFENPRDMFHEKNDKDSIEQFLRRCKVVYLTEKYVSPIL